MRNPYCIFKSIFKLFDRKVPFFCFNRNLSTYFCNPQELAFQFLLFIIWEFTNRFDFLMLPLVNILSSKQPLHSNSHILSACWHIDLQNRGIIQINSQLKKNLILFSRYYESNFRPYWLKSYSIQPFSQKKPKFYKF